jgi:F420-dependent oxidoreductase-like protein
MKGMTIGVHIARPNAKEAVDGIVAAEQAGIDCAWMTSGGVAPDPLAVFSAAAMRTERILMGSCIIPTFPRHPLALVQGSVTVDSLAPGRLRLGVGPSHIVSVEPTFGIPFVRPLEHLRDYLTILRAALYEGKVDYQGPRLTARATLPGGPTGVKVMASALRQNGFRLCGELADGAISWMCPLPYIRDVASPALKEGAAKAGREAPPLVTHVPVVVTDDKAGVYAGAQRQVSFYARVPYYSQMFQDAGFTEAKEGQFSERMTDAIVISGSASEVKDRLRALPEYGVGELLAMPILPPGDERASLERTLAVLGELAAE